MPYTRASVDAQMEAAVQGILAADERVIARILTLRGPSPWLTKSWGLLALPFLVLYYLTVTDRRVIVHRLRPGTNDIDSLVFIDQANMVEITNVRYRPLWSSLRYNSPNTPKPIRLNIHRNKRALMKQVVGHLTTSGRSGLPHGLPRPDDSVTS